MLLADEPWWTLRLATTGLDELIDQQDGVVGRDQLLLGGVSEVVIRRKVRRREWTVVWPRVYAIRPGAPTAYGNAIGALLYSGPTATWSHATAAYQLGLRKTSPAGLDVSIDATRRVRDQPGLRIHRVTRLGERRLAGLTPPRVTGAHSVIDQLAERPSLARALALVADSCQSRRVSLDDILTASHSRPHRWGAELRAMAGDTLRGSDSILEVMYVRDVELRHRLPTSTRQRSLGQDIADCSYDDFGILVELDGRLHLVADRRWRDMAKDNRSALRGELTLRYGWFDVHQNACGVALQVTRVLRQRGFRGHVRPCRVACPVSHVVIAA